MADKELFNDYTSALAHNAQMAEDTLRGVFGTFNNKMSSQEIQAQLREYYPALVRKYGDRAAQVAIEYYTDERNAYLKATGQELDGYEPTIPNSPNNKLLQADVDGVFKQYNAKEQFGSVYNALAGNTVNRVMKMSDATLDRAMRKDKLRPKWALVAGLKACAWCSLVSSFGFHYNSQFSVQKARHTPRPTACRCSICVDFNEKSQLKGYDPDAMYSTFKGIADDLGIDFTRENQAGSKARKRILDEYAKRAAEKDK